MNNHEKGKLYEKVINTHINTLPTTSISFLWNDVPEQVLFDAGLMTDYNKHRLERKNKNVNIDPNDPINSLKDIGIDIIQIDIDGHIIFVQCKNYSNSLTIEDLAGFSWMMAQHHQNQGIVYYSTDKISRNIKATLVTDRIKFIYKPVLLPKIKIKIKLISKIKLYDYQDNIVKLYNKYYKTNDKAVLSMPCGTGKTLVSCYISKEYDLVIFISPLKQFAEQNIDRYKEYDPNRHYELIDSDGIRDFDEIKNIIKKHKKVMLSVTYKSCDIITQLRDALVNPFIIVDEFHNLSSKNIYGAINEDVKDCENNEEEDTVNSEEDIEDIDKKKDPLNQLINSNYKMLYMSATPRIYELEDNNDCDIEDILGKVVYKMDFKTAIENKYITDYNIYLPIMEDNSKIELDGLITEIKTELKTNLDDRELSQKCCYLYECIKQFGTLKCIIYFQSHEHIENFIKCFNKINEYYSYEYKIDSITCNDSRKERREKINVFKKNENNSFLCAVNILDECIDLPECNSIYVPYNCKSKVKNVQRMSRAIRLDKNNQNKKAKIILWCDEISDMTTYMSSIKEIDLNYNEKVRYMRFNRGLIKEDKKETEKYAEKYSKYIIGVQEYRGFNWSQTLNRVEQFIIANQWAPSQHSKNIEEKQMGTWVITQQRSYKNKIQIMKNQEIYDKWTEFTNKYEQCFRSHEKNWKITLDNVETFIISNKKTPSRHSKNIEEKQLNRWINYQKISYKKKENIMKNQEIYNIWTVFINKYKKHFNSAEENWNITLDNVETFIIANKKRPVGKSKNKEENQMSTWIHYQQKNYKNKANIMKNQEIYDKWTEFTNKYGECLRPQSKNWNIILDNVDTFIIANKKAPSIYSKNIKEKQMGMWVYNQQKKYKKKEQIMKTHEIYNKWTEFINKHKEML